eukprot:13013901-Heterocapsa_arctica.AAC.1
MAVATLGRMFRGRRVLLFVDNDGARGSLIQGSSTALPSARVVNDFWAMAADLELYVWIDRVPSAAKPADGPSRHDVAWLEAQGFRGVEASFG